MKNFLLFTSLLLLFASCKKDQEDPILPDPTPTIVTFDGDIGANDNSTFVTPDDNLLICGNTGDYYSLLKISKAGAQIWRKDFDNDDGSHASGITITGNQDVFICGWTMGNNQPPNRDILLVKTNSVGDTLWTRTYGNANDELGYYIITTDDNNLLICGVSYGLLQDSICDIYLLKVNTEGDTIWTRTFTYSDQELPFHLLQTQDGDYLITGANEQVFASRQLYLLKVKDDGTSLWNKKIGPPSGRTGYSTAELPNGDLITCGKTTKDDTSQLYLVKTDSQGNVNWEKEYGERHRAEQGYAISVNADGTCIITGGTYQAHTGQRSILLLKIDSNGEPIVMKDFGQQLINYGQNIILDVNGDYLFTGVYNSRIFITRTDDNCVFK